MRTVKSERLKKLETELNDLEQWLKLGLVPKKDQEKHKEEIAGVKEKISEEKERLQLLRESGDAEDYVAPKRTPQRGYSEMPTIPDIDMAETGAGFETEEEGETSQTASEERTIYTEDEEEKDEGEEDEEEEEEEVEEESYFSDKNRWKRGGIIDPDANEW